jgi:hypothetical protein
MKSPSHNDNVDCVPVLEQISWYESGNVTDVILHNGTSLSGSHSISSPQEDDYDGTNEDFDDLIYLAYEMRDKRKYYPFRRPYNSAEFGE